MEEQLILVDEHDNEVGTMGKLEAHKRGLLHRCFSIFVFHPDGRLMLQKRAKEKYHSGGLWTNTCCGHQRPGEASNEAAHRRLQFEMGFDCPLEEVHTFLYKAELNNGITEHEFDHVFVGSFDGTPELNPEEAEDWKWVEPAELQRDFGEHPDRYTYWLRISFADVLDKVRR